MLTQAISNTLGSVRNMLSRLENPTFNLNDPNAWNLSEASTSEAGIAVSHRSALELDAVFQAVTLISGDIASINTNVYREETIDEKDVETIDRYHPADYLLSSEANKETSSFEFRRRLNAHALLWGNGYAFVERNASGNPSALYNLLPDRTGPVRDENGDLYYITETTKDGQRVIQFIRQEDMIHLRGVSIENEVAINLVRVARNTIGLALAAANFSSKFFANGAMAGGVLEIPPHWTQKAKDNLEQGFSKTITGKSNWFKVAILRDGAKFHQMTIDAQKSQLHELREDQVRAIARYFNLPPFKLGLTDSISYNSTEQLQLIYLTGTLLHWMKAEASEYNMKLRTIPQKTRRTHRIKHDPSPLLELDQKTHNEVLEIQRRNLIITGNEWRREINMPPSTDPNADKLLNPNTTTDTTAAEDDQQDDPPIIPDEQETEEPEDVEENKLNRLIKAHQNLLIHSCGVMARRLNHDALRLAKDESKFLEWLDSNLKDNRILFKTAFEPILQTIAVTHDMDVDQLFVDMEAAFFDNIETKLQSITVAPYRSKDLLTNTEVAMISYQNQIAATMINVFNTSLEKDESHAATNQ